MNLIRPSTIEDVEYTFLHMRQEDVNECLAGKVEPLDALLFGLNQGKVCYTLIDPKTGNPAGMVGVCDSMHDLGYIWLLGTDAIERNSVAFLRNSKPTLGRLFDETGYKALGNFTHAKNELHHRWLKWLGFTFLRKVELTPNNHFYEFVKLGG